MLGVLSSVMYCHRMRMEKVIQFVHYSVLD